MMKRVCVTVTLMSIVAFIAGIVLSSYFIAYPVSTDTKESRGEEEQTQLFSNVNAHPPVMLRPAGFPKKIIKAIDVSVAGSLQSDPDARVQFFKGSCNETAYNESILLPNSRILTPLNDKNEPVNYYYSDFPLSSAGGNNSTLTYDVAVSGYSNSSICPELYLFDSMSSYKKSLDAHRNVTGFVEKSGCIPLGTNTTVKFHLKQPSYYYATIKVQRGLSVKLTISGHVLQYSTDHYSLYKNCSLTVATNACRITINENLSAANVCILVQTNYNDYVVVNYSLVSTSSVGSESNFIGSGIGLAFSIFALILVICIIIVSLKPTNSRNDLDEERPLCSENDQRQDLYEQAEQHKNSREPVQPENTGLSNELHKNILKEQMKDFQ